MHSIPHVHPLVVTLVAHYINHQIFHLYIQTRAEDAQQTPVFLLDLQLLKVVSSSCSLCLSPVPFGGFLLASAGPRGTV